MNQYEISFLNASDFVILFHRAFMMKYSFIRE
jgi:hypothetical protein